MSAMQQLGNITFGNVLVGVFSTQDGLTYDGKSVEPIQCTVDTDATTTFVASDLPTYGQFTATIYFEDGTTNLDSVVGTTETLTWTWPQASGATSKVISGSAFLVSASTTASQDILIQAAVVFQWTGEATTTVAT